MDAHFLLHLLKIFCAKTSQKIHTYTLFTAFSRFNVHDFYADSILTRERQGVNHTEPFVRKGVDTQLHTYNTRDFLGFLFASMYCSRTETLLASMFLAADCHSTNEKLRIFRAASDLKI
jgi:hypothetical protein